MNPNVVQKLFEVVGGPISVLGGIIGYQAGEAAKQDCMSFLFSNPVDCPEPATWAAIGAAPGALHLLYKLFLGIKD